ncbi:hypothetical protein VZT92_016677 [Zoarces viviparus]|uniref:Secreted protein n=1 Tax=Zoarces viviparus TaxID=48416 RepID=A0AAW1EUN8_ZOAVI
MKSVQAAALSVMKMKMKMMMMVVLVSVSAGPLPPSVNRSHLLNVTEGNSSRFFSPNVTMNEFSAFMRIDRPCVLATCLIVNLASSLQRGDETAGGLTTDPFGNGKK